MDPANRPLLPFAQPLNSNSRPTRIVRLPPTPTSSVPLVKNTTSLIPTVLIVTLAVTVLTAALTLSNSGHVACGAPSNSLPTPSSTKGNSEVGENAPDLDQDRLGDEEQDDDDVDDEDRGYGSGENEDYDDEENEEEVEGEAVGRNATAHGEEPPPPPGPPAKANELPKHPRSRWLLVWLVFLLLEIIAVIFLVRRLGGLTSLSRNIVMRPIPVKPGVLLTQYNSTMDAPWSPSRDSLSIPPPSHPTPLPPPAPPSIQPLILPLWNFTAFIQQGLVPWITSLTEQSATIRPPASTCRWVAILFYQLSRVISFIVGHAWQRFLSTGIIGAVTFILAGQAWYVIGQWIRAVAEGSFGIVVEREIKRVEDSPNTLRREISPSQPPFPSPHQESTDNASLEVHGRDGSRSWGVFELSHDESDLRRVETVEVAPVILASKNLRISDMYAAQNGPSPPPDNSVNRASLEVHRPGSPEKINVYVEDPRLHHSPPPRSSSPSNALGQAPQIACTLSSQDSGNSLSLDIEDLLQVTGQLFEERPLAGMGFPDDSLLGGSCDDGAKENSHKNRQQETKERTAMRSSRILPPQTSSPRPDPVMRQSNGNIFEMYQARTNPISQPHDDLADASLDVLGRDGDGDGDDDYLVELPSIEMIHELPPHLPPSIYRYLESESLESQDRWPILQEQEQCMEGSQFHQEPPPAPQRFSLGQWRPPTPPRPATRPRNSVNKVPRELTSGTLALVSPIGKSSSTPAQPGVTCGAITTRRGSLSDDRVDYREQRRESGTILESRVEGLSSTSGSSRTPRTLTPRHLSSRSSSVGPSHSRSSSVSPSTISSAPSFELYPLASTQPLATDQPVVPVTGSRRVGSSIPSSHSCPIPNASLKNASLFGKCSVLKPADPSVKEENCILPHTVSSLSLLGELSMADEDQLLNESLPQNDDEESGDEWELTEEMREFWRLRENQPALRLITASGYSLDVDVG